MAVLRKQDRGVITAARRQELIRLAEEVDAGSGIVGDPGITAEELQERLKAEGIRPEGNIASRELMRLRYGDDRGEEG